MENQEEILQKINSGDPEAVQDAIQTIKENGDLSIAGKLLDILEQNQDPNNSTIMINLLADIKENAFKAIVIQKLETTSQYPFKQALLRIIWESALDYSSYLDHFLELLQSEHFELAFEASTVIENLIPHLTTEQIAKLNQTLPSFPGEKKVLTENIIQALLDQE